MYEADDLSVLEYQIPLFLSAHSVDPYFVTILESVVALRFRCFHFFVPLSLFSDIIVTRLAEYVNTFLKKIFFAIDCILQF